MCHIVGQGRNRDLRRSLRQGAQLLFRHATTGPYPYALSLINLFFPEMKLAASNLLFCLALAQATVADDCLYCEDATTTAPAPSSRAIVASSSAPIPAASSSPAYSAPASSPTSAYQPAPAASSSPSPAYIPPTSPTAPPAPLVSTSAVYIPTPAPLSSPASSTACTSLPAPASGTGYIQIPASTPGAPPAGLISAATPTVYAPQPQAVSGTPLSAYVPPAGNKPAQTNLYNSGADAAARVGGVLWVFGVGLALVL
ncbi:hypothetical protein BC830DRAFT_461086 [Chytriomyces sp. MP71]|nr:hypothetical protein BC830DRAFT_461086 [Chytriomyces sp. MP71]